MSLPYETTLENAINGRWYQLDPKRLFPVRDDHIDEHRTCNLVSLAREPHKLYNKRVGRNGIYMYYTYDFELTETDRISDAKEIKEGSMWFRRNNIHINSYYRYDINKLIIEDVVLKQKYEKEQKVKQFLKRCIGPAKEALYAPPGVYGEKGGMLYRASLRGYTQKKKTICKQ